ncbi:hypothetical protein [Streptomyces sp. NPDC017260]|uniref:hypothetical protein n=1 Tax=unclassified Streptomyces TaxID=2593676 RepID=UPI0037AC47A2
MAETGVTSVGGHIIEGHRRGIMAHLTSWVQNNTGVVTDPEALDSASLEQALGEVNRAVYDTEGETYRKPLGAQAQQVLAVAELVMQRAVHYVGRGDQYAEGQCVQAVHVLLDEAGSYFAELAKECTECEQSHYSAGILCPSCRKPFQENMPAECRWFIVCGEEGDERDVWYLRNGIGSETLIFAYNADLGWEGEPEAELWAAGVMKADYGISVTGWEPAWEGEPTNLSPDYWIAETQTATEGGVRHG